MILFASVIVLAFVIGFIAGGHLSGFEGVQVRWWGLALIGLAVQFVPLPEGEGGTDLVVRTIVLAVSYGFLLTFAIKNVRLPGVALILVGLTLNAAVIVSNGGMPVSAEALRTSDQTEVLEDLQQAGADKHHLETEDDVLTPLGDVVGIPSPLAQAVSIGDVLVYAGLMWFVISAMRGRIRPSSSDAPGYRGKHRSARTSASPGRHAQGLPAATTSGTEP
jgi:hypothetical protein